MACEGYPTQQTAKTFALDAGTTNEVVTKQQDRTDPASDGKTKKTFWGIENEWNYKSQDIQDRADQQNIDIDNAAEQQRQNIESTFTAQFAYKRIGNISLYVGDSLQEADKLNSYQHPDDSGEWYGPVQDQAFPITIPADPSSDDGWALVNALTTYGLSRYTAIAYDSIGNMLGGIPIKAKAGDLCYVESTLFKRVSVSSPTVISDFEIYGYQYGCSGVSQKQIEDALNGPHKRSLLALPQEIEIEELRTPNRSELVGFGEDVILKAKTPNKTMINMRSVDGSALSNVTLKDFQIDADFKAGVTCIDMDYASVQSMLDGIRISNLGDSSIGVRISKEWYARTQRCSIRSDKSLGSGSIGVLVDTSSGQVNDVPLDFQINGVETAVEVDTLNAYVYKLVLPDTFHAEQCDIGLRVKSGYGVRQAVIRGYFESNSVADCIWGDVTAGANDITQTVLWQSVSFNPTGSKIVLYEGRHIFDGCDRIDTLEINRDATVEIRGGIISNIVNNTGDDSRVIYRPSITDIIGGSIYANSKLRNPKEKSLKEETTSNSVTFPIDGIFGNKPANGRSATCEASVRSVNETSEKIEVFKLTQRADGQWGMTSIFDNSASGMVVSVDPSSGYITVTDDRSTSRVYTLRVSPI